MITIKSKKDLLIAGNWLENATYQLACREFENITRGLPNYNPENDGWLVIFTSSTSDIHAQLLFKCNWIDVAWDGVIFREDSDNFIAIKVLNNQFVHTVIVTCTGHFAVPGLIQSLQEALC